MSTDVAEYLFAARRKVDIGRYHRDALEEARGDSTTAQPVLGVALPSVRFQAHFEGLLFAVDAIPDQLAGAFNVGATLGLKGMGVDLKKVRASSERGARPVPSALVDAIEWAEKIRYIRDIRNAAAHRYHLKTFVGQDMVVRIPWVCRRVAPWTRSSPT